MSAPTTWLPAEPDQATILDQYPNPIQALAEAKIPALMLRQAYDPAQCTELVKRFTQWGLMRNPQDPNSADQRARIDIGTSLGNRGTDKADFLDHAVATHDLFAHLFDGFDNPVTTLYNALSAMAPGKAVQTAREADGRLYGPAIFRIHYTTHSYIPHIDSVRLREKRTNYSVYRFEHQFAGILCLQNALHGERSAQTIVHNCLWDEEIQPHLANGTFHNFAKANEIDQYRVDLAPGDLYFFNTRCIHEIPPLDGNNPRIVLAVFIGYSPDDPEVYVWA